MYEDFIDSMREVAKEGKEPADKDSEETKIKKLNEDKVNEREWFIYIPEEGDWPINYSGDDFREARQTYLKWAKRSSLPAGSKIWSREGSKESAPDETKESKVNELDDEEKAPRPEDITPVPKDDEEAPEITKEYLGKTEDTHFYIISTDEPEDLQVVDQEGVMKYSARDNNLEIADIPKFIIQAIQDVEIDGIERSIFMKYILPILLEEEEPEEEEEEFDEEGRPKKRRPKRVPPEELEEPEEEEPVESKQTEKKKPPVCKKCNKAHWPFQKCKEAVDEKSRQTKEGVTDDIALAMSNELKKAGESVTPFSDMAECIARYDNEIASEVIKKLIGLGIVVEGKEPADKDSEETKIKKLIEMKVIDDEGNEFDATLVDDGTIDTVIEINGREFRFSPEFASMWRDPYGGLSEEGLKELTLDALANMEEEEYNELVGQGQTREEEPIDGDETHSPAEETTSPVEPEKEVIEPEVVEPVAVESKVTERALKDMSEAELNKILGHLRKVAHFGFDVKSRIKEVEDALSQHKESDEGKEPADKDSEETKIKKLAEEEIDEVKDLKDYSDKELEDLLGRLTKFDNSLPGDADIKATIEKVQAEIDRKEQVEKESKVTEAGEKKPGAKVRHRGDVVFPAESSKVTDDKDHFPINDAGQARNALARANQYSSAPEWYRGSLESLVKKVASAVHKKYPSIEISKAAKKPGKESKENKVKVEFQEESLDEKKHLNRLNNLLNL